ncbi:MAG: chemotaxis protein CheC [Chloroflexi bacterium]|nr:chemotaxis protein CheC [Chloroflexota bacterium]
MDLTADQIDALKKLVNIGVGKAAGVLNTMLQSHVRLQIPFLEILSSLELGKKVQNMGKEALSVVKLAFQGSFAGTASLVFPTESAAKLVTVLTNDEMDSSDLDAIRIGTLTEVGNIVLNGVMGVVSNKPSRHIRFSVPAYVEDPIETLLSSSNPDLGEMAMWAQARFTIEQYQIDGDIILLFKVGSFDVLMDAIS